MRQFDFIYEKGRDEFYITVIVNRIINTLHMPIWLYITLELSCLKRRQKSPNHKTGLGNRDIWRFWMILNDSWWLMGHSCSLMNNSVSFRIFRPYFLNQFLGWGSLAASYSKRALEILFKNHGIIRKLSKIHPAPIFILISVN